MRRFAPPALLLAPFLLAGCGGTGPSPRPAAASSRPPPPVAEAGLGRVMGHEAPALLALFGAPSLDLREGPARKLQFRGPACVLDAYLYPQAGGSSRVTWIDSRTPRGADIDRASCIAALSRR